MLSHQTISRVILLAIIAGLALAFFKASSTQKEPVLREYYECIQALCTTLEGAGESCTYFEPHIARISIVSDSLGKIIKVAPSNDRCE